LTRPRVSDRYLGVFSLGWTAALVAAALAACSEAAERPNILFILADDLGYGDLACYGHPRIRTPNLDRLAREGMRFTQFYVTSPVCTPSRASFMTGRHPQRFGIHHADLPEQLPRYPLPASARLVSELLKTAGYRTAHFGKWHLGEPPWTVMPRSQGFDLFFGSLGGRPSSSWIKFARYDDAQFILNEEQPRSYAGYATDITADRASEFLGEAARGGAPFYCNVWFNAPHEPLSPAVRQAAGYADLAGRNPKEPVYFGTVENLDWNVGRLLARLDALGLAVRTLVVFSSDNGPEVHTMAWSAGSAGPMRGMKTQLWEGGIRVPMIARLPGTIPAGRVTDAVASALDFLPTVAELAGVEVPNRRELDEGISLVPLLGGRQEARVRTLFWEFHAPQRGGPPSGSVAVRSGDWKLHLVPESSRRELYDLKSDVGEKNNVAAEHPDVVARLEKQALAWYAALPKETAPKSRVAPPATEAEANHLPIP
jgi:arylsulfatase A-like enzyme